MKYSLACPDLSNYVSRQINNFFPDEQVQSQRLKPYLEKSMDRMATAIKSCTYFQKNGEPFFDHLHTDQYAMFLYLLSNQLGKDPAQKRLATKIYYLNKALHSIDIFYEVQLPPAFMFAHPVGTVLGRATYGNYFVVRQATTVGNIKGKHPVIGDKVVLCSNVNVLGECALGDGVCVGAKTLLVNAEVPAYHNVVGSPGDIRIWPSKRPMWREYFDV